MQPSSQNDNMDYDNPEFNVNGNVEYNHAFEDMFDETASLDVNQQVVEISQQVQVVEPDFEDQETQFLDAAYDVDSSRGLGLRSKILLLLVFLVTASLGTSLFSTLKGVRTTHFENLYANRLLVAEGVGQNLEGFFTEKVSQLLIFGSTQRIQDSVEQHNLAYVENYGEDYSLFLQEINTRQEQWLNATEDDALVNSIVTNDIEVNAASHQLTSFISKYSDVYSDVLITDQYGAAVASSHSLSNYYHGDQEWWKKAWADGQGEVYISDLTYNEISQTDGFTIALPLYSDAGKILGVLRSTLNVAELEAFVAEPRFDETGYATLLNGSGDVIVDPGLAFGHNAAGIPLASRKQLVTNDRESFDLTDEAGDRSKFVSLNVLADTAFNQSPVQTVGESGVAEYTAISEAMGYLRNQSLAQAINDLGLTLVMRQKFSEASQVVDQANKWNILIFVLTLLTTLFFGVIFARRLTKPLNHLVDVMRQVGAGDFSTLAKVNTKDEIGLLAGSVNDTVIKLREMVRTENERDVAQLESEVLQSSIGGFLDVITDVAQGDLTRRGEVSADILGNVIDATNVMVEEVGFLLSNVKQTATQVGYGAQNMILSSESIAESNQGRVQTANQLAEAVHSVSQSMQQMAGQVDTAAATALQTYSASQEGSLVVRDTLAGMQNIRQEVQTISKRIKNLGDRSLEISEIVETIRHLASQTNLLALNAAIEAAGAGEAGGRFAIVADEVRKLAENSAQATERVSSLIQSVQEEVQDVVISVEDGIREVEGGYELATQAGQRLDAIGQQAQTSAGLAQKIAELVREQVQRVGIVNSNLQMMSSSGTESQHVVAEGKQIAEQLQLLSQELLASLSHFRLEEEPLQLVD